MIQIKTNNFFLNNVFEKNKYFFHNLTVFFPLTQLYTCLKRTKKASIAHPLVCLNTV